MTKNPIRWLTGVYLRQHLIPNVPLLGKIKDDWYVGLIFLYKWNVYFTFICSWIAVKKGENLYTSPCDRLNLLSCRFNLIPRCKSVLRTQYSPSLIKTDNFSSGSPRWHVWKSDGRQIWSRISHQGDFHFTPRPNKPSLQATVDLFCYLLLYYKWEGQQGTDKLRLCQLVHGEYLWSKKTGWVVRGEFDFFPFRVEM